MRQSLTALFYGLTFCFLQPWLSAQITDVTSVQSPPIPAAGHGYVQMLNETVNPSNGALSIRINVPVAAGRHLTVPFEFGYDSNTSNFISAQGYAGSNSYLSAGGWSYIVPHLDYQHKDVSYYEQWLNGAPVGSTKYPCDLYNDHIFTDPQGGTHALFLAMFANVSGCNQYLAGFNPTNVTTGTDGKVTATVNGTGQWPPITVSDASGTAYYFSGPWHNASTFGYSSLPAWIENSNGDKVTITDSGSGVFTMVDTLGRNAIASSGFGTTGNTVTVSGLTGSYKLTWGTASSTWVPGWSTTTDCTGSSCGSCLPVQQGSPATIPVITQITLPDNTSYKFQYDTTYGVINKITYPTGGYVRYDWQVNTRSDAIDFYLDNTNNPQTTNFNCHERFDTVAVHHRYVSADGNSAHEYEQQTFSLSATQWSFPNSGLPGYGVWNAGGKTTTIVTNDTLRSTSTQTFYSYAPLNLTPNPYDGSWRFVFNGNCQSSCNTDGIVWSPSTYRQYPVEQVTKFEDGSGNVLKTVTQSFSDQYRMNCAVTSISDVAPAAISGAFYTWGAGDQLTDKKEYDFGLISDPTTCEANTVPSGTPTRETKASYASFAATLAGGSILDRPSIIQVNGNGVLAAETDYSYDGSALASVTNATGHDTGYSTTYTNRGNATTETRKCFIGANACTNATYGYQFDQTGQITSVTDPLGNATQYKYNDAYTALSGGSNVSYTPSGNTNAFVTTITNPLAQASTFTYDYNSSEVTALKDPNDINAGRAGTTYIYADSFARPTVKSLPDGGQTEYVYNDAAPSTTICELINGTAGASCSATTPASGWKTTLVTMDGLDRVVQKALVSDPGGATYTGTVYDGMGHVYEITNPYRSTSDPTYGVTTTFYDALDRVCLVVPADGTLPSGSACPASRPSGDALTVYDQRNGSSGICTTVTDEAGMSRQSCADGLGRMTSVWEDPSGLNYETDYTYDALNDLLSVTQKGGSANSSQWRPRSFSYDSLSRLTSATNPESGNMGYVYDANGNVTTKTAPANQTSGTLTTTYKYDALNRLTSKTYSGDAAATPSSCYQYDLSSTTNGIGRLANVWTQSASQGSCPKSLPASGLVTKRSILSYDALGRITSEQQCTPFNCSSTTPYALSFNYDPAGNLSKYTNGISTTPGATANPLSFTNCFDAAGRFQTTMSNWNDATHPASLFSAQMSQSSTCSGSSGPTVSKAPYSPAGALQNAFYGTGLGLTRTYDNRLRITGEQDTAGH